MTHRFELIVLGLLSVAPRQVLGQVTVQFDAANPPFMFQRGGAPAGLYPVLFAEAFRRAGVKATLRAVPWRRALAALDAGRAGVGGIYQNAERAAKYDFSPPFFQERIAIYFPAGKDASGTLEDLLGKRVGVLRGWSYGDAFDAAAAAGKLSREEVESDEQNLRKLAGGRLDAVLAIVESGDEQVRAAKLETRVKRLPGLLLTNPVHLAFAKSADKKDVLAKFAAAIEAMKKDGSFDAIVKAELGR